MPLSPSYTGADLAPEVKEDLRKIRIALEALVTLEVIKMSPMSPAAEKLLKLAHQTSSLTDVDEGTAFKTLARIMKALHFSES